jgi:hypothetical protein
MSRHERRRVGQHLLLAQPAEEGLDQGRDVPDLRFRDEDLARHMVEKAYAASCVQCDLRRP